MKCSHFDRTALLCLCQPAKVVGMKQKGAQSGRTENRWLSGNPACPTSIIDRGGTAEPVRVCVCVSACMCVCVCVPLSHCLWEFLSFTNRLFFLFFFYFFFAHTLSPLPFTVKFSDLHAHLKQNIVRAKKKTLSERPEEGFRYSNVLTFYSFMLAKQICLQCSAKNFKTNIKHLHGSMPNGWES